MSIRIDSLTKKFAGRALFDHISLDIPLDKTTVMAGSSGCGKTTLLRIIAGLDRDYDGSVSGVPERISFMFQEDRLLPWYSVYQNIEFVLKDVMGRTQMHDVVNEIIAAVQLTGHEDKLPSKLSGGMKRRVAMARAFCCPADLLLLDEPFKGFDAKLKSDMIALFERLYVKTNKTVILVTHDDIAGLGRDIIDLDGIRSMKA
ncbi:MAG: ATP-binding cassette domain-containing protein [Eubacteriales bacterium]|nr:ATP-binding cassette domain-containing protein [Eubacteriales bacterium]